MDNASDASQNLFQQQSILANENADDLDIAFQEAACVLVSFEPEHLHPFNKSPHQETEESDLGWGNFIWYCEPVKGKSEKNWWRLNSSVRRQALKRLGTRENMISALLANAERPTELAQSFLEDILFRRNLAIKQLKREELVFLSDVLDWLRGIIDVSEEIAAVQQALPMADLLAPMRRLVSNNFVGRQDELDRLVSYVADSRTTPPLLLYGPGGVGKSTLLAKFILNTVGEGTTGPIPFVYLDIDRPVLNVKQPTTFIIEAARQLSAQLPALSGMFARLIDDTDHDLASYEEFDSEKSFVSSAPKADQLASILAHVKTTILFIVDTFEEAQYFRGAIVNELWTLLLTLQRSAPNLRIIVAGRVMEEELTVNPFPLEDLNRSDAKLLLSRSLGQQDGNGQEPVMEEIIDELINLVGLNPLSLRLASIIVNEQGIEKLRDPESRKWIALRIHAEALQAKLYGRILAHIHDEEVKKLACPGLLLRRITPDIIKKVLASPCDLKITSEQQAIELFFKLSEEVSLVEFDPLDGNVLIHRQDVRRIMLTDLVDELPDETIRIIHNRAIRYYSKRNDDVSRAEEIYHRLARGDNPKNLESRWDSDLAGRLGKSLEELPPKQRIWLSHKLGVTPNTDLQKRANLQDWENTAAITAQRYLNTGNAEKALATVRERSERTPTSQLYGIELKALRRLGRFEEANTLVELALSSVRNQASTSMIRELLLQATLIKEAEGHYNEALMHIEEASNMLSNQQDPIEVLRIQVAHIRLLRKLGDSWASEHARLIKQAKELLNEESVLNSLRKSPSLLRELTAELGKIMPELLQNAINTIGLEIREEGQVSTLSQAFVDWNETLRANSHSDVGELVVRAGINDSSLGDWSSFIQNNSIKEVVGSIQHWRSELSDDENTEANTTFDNALVDIFRQTVDLSLNRSVGNVSFDETFPIQTGSSDLSASL